ncbi:MAG: 3-hydroxyacyl-CoA dehydrogenase/enoyl-CoA hydratase family protein [Planctomycetota bacterium]|nr:3-hydroxyacyl-CoA dehydrogenase/enoyl-CoA hydratase family protein [Planctomycetota bacterium]
MNTDNLGIQIQGRPVTRIGIIGSGQIGPDIALHFSKVFTPLGAPIVVIDIDDVALEKGRKKLDRKIDKGIEFRAFGAEQGQAMKDNVLFTSDYDQLKGCDLVVEAATEDKNLKARIFTQIAELVPAHAVLCSNSSHLEPEVIFEGLENRSRTMVVHYFFPAERNPIVEIVPGADTSSALANDMMGFYEAIGKIPIRVGSRYGYALDPVFEGMFLASALLAEQGIASSKEIDQVACDVLGYTVGPFTAMNLTGGNPITAVGLDHYNEKIHRWYHTPEILRRAVADETSWEVPGRGEKIEVPQETFLRVRDALLGSFFGIVGEIVDSGISSIEDMDMAVEMALDMKAPFRLMNSIGVQSALELVQQYSADHPEFPIPDCISKQAEAGQPFQISTVLRQDVDGIAHLLIRRPKQLNALNNSAFDQIEKHFLDIASDDEVVGVVLSGFGIKAFVSGADVPFLAQIESSAMGEATSRGSQKSIQTIEDCPKPVICALNGLAFGGGNEIAMACNARIARANQRILVGQPEVNLGIIPGAGGTQRLPRWVGVEKAAELMRTGRPVSSAEALAIGLIQEEVDGDPRALRHRAVELIRAHLAGEPTLPSIQRGPIETPDTLPEVDLGHLSRQVDAVLQKAIVEGCRLPLKEGIALEARYFGEVCGTQDMRIGVSNFLENGPRTPAKFVHA